MLDEEDGDPALADLADLVDLAEQADQCLANSIVSAIQGAYSPYRYASASRDHCSVCGAAFFT